MAVFVTGASGSIGGAVAARVVEAGRDVRGRVRSEEKAQLLTSIRAVRRIGGLDDAEMLTREARGSEGVVNAELKWNPKEESLREWIERDA